MLSKIRFQNPSSVIILCAVLMDIFSQKINSIVQYSQTMVISLRQYTDFSKTYLKAY